MATQYKCAECGKTFKKWVGKCNNCNEYSSLEEVEVAEAPVARDGVKTAARLPSTAAKSISNTNRKVDRFETGIRELDRVLGGGFVHSGVALLGGEPGAGKSTLALRVSEIFANSGKKVLYASGEESVEQISIRADRMGVTNEDILLVHTASLDEILGQITTEKPELFIVDSLQAIASSSLTGSVGSVQQSREAAHALNRIAKETQTRAILINQITKDGDFAGPEAIQHVVDVSLLLEGSRESPLKFLRTLKNRFGSTDEVGIFQHSDTGLEEVLDPTGMLTEDSDNALASGASYTIASEGLRQLPVEVQALVTPSTLPNPRKQFNGVQMSRGQIICAILDKFCKTNLAEYDVFASTMFGVKLLDPISDLAVAAAILSSREDTSQSERIAYIGELSLTGQVRGAHRISQKIAEAARGGFAKIVIPHSALKQLPKGKQDIEVVTVKTVKDLRRIVVES